MKVRRSFAAAVLSVLFCTGVYAEEIYLKSGEILNAEIIKNTAS
jgi:hypothetical protein